MCICVCVCECVFVDVKEKQFFMFCLAMTTINHVLSLKCMHDGVSFTLPPLLLLSLCKPMYISERKFWFILFIPLAPSLAFFFCLFVFVHGDAL